MQFSFKANSIYIYFKNIISKNIIYITQFGMNCLIWIIFLLIIFLNIGISLEIKNVTKMKMLKNTGIPENWSIVKTVTKLLTSSYTLQLCGLSSGIEVDALSITNSYNILIYLVYNYHLCLQLLSLSITIISVYNYYLCL